MGDLAVALTLLYVLPDTFALGEMELDVLRGAAAGESVQDTATRRERSTNTVKKQRAHIIVKMQVKSLAEAVAKAAHAGIV